MLSKHVCMFYSLKNGLTIAINEREKKKTSGRIVIGFSVPVKFSLNVF